MPVRPCRRRSLAGVVLIGAVGLVAGLMRVDDESDADPRSAEPSCPTSAAAVVDGGGPPNVTGVTWVSLPAGEQAPPPVRSEPSAGAIPTNQWWSSALVGPGTQPLWARPLAVQVMPDGALHMSNESPDIHDDGTSATAFIPALTVPAPLPAPDPSDAVPAAGPSDAVPAAGSSDAVPAAGPSEAVPASVVVTGWGDFHVSLAVRVGRGEVAPPDGQGDAPELGVDVVAGSPFVELTFVGRPVVLTAGSTGPADAPTLELVPIDDRSASIRIRGRSWVVAADRAVEWTADAGSVEARPLDDGPVDHGSTGDESAESDRPSGVVRLVVGPVPLVDRRSAGRPVDASVVDPAAWASRAAVVASNPVASTSEHTSVLDDGSVEQRLVVDRQTGSGGRLPTLWALGPHQQNGTDQPVGWLPDPRGPSSIVAADELVLHFDAVPILWAPAAPDGTAATGAPDGTAATGAPDGTAATGAPDGTAAVPVTSALLSADLEAGPARSTGSYFGGKRVAYDAALADLSHAYGEASVRADALDRVRTALDALLAGTGPGLAWNGEWGTVVVTPAEFGAGNQLNDHHLQYGYWVAAAATLAEADPAWATRAREAIDLLVADYAGGAQVPCAPAALAAQRTWDPQAGHSWASGLAPFADGNNLESTGESLHAWWAAARWFMATGRPELAEPFVARLTIEARVAGAAWFPVVADGSARPWFGIVWSAKTDLGTWFDPAPESALGIQLLPLGPVSLTRYPDADAVAAARQRWAWCSGSGDGCATRWTNLLASDAAVAGVDPPSGPDPEPSVPSSMLAWWHGVWAASHPAPASCTPGAVLRAASDGAITLLAVNVGPEPIAVHCRLADGRAFMQSLDAGERYAGPITL